MSTRVDHDPLADLPGELLMWVLIVSELLVFGAGLMVFLAIRITDPAGFASAQAHLHNTGAALSTLVLVTSGFLAAKAYTLTTSARLVPARLALIAAASLGLAFLVIKASEYFDLASQGIGTETHVFFTFYYLLTGFHAAHVAAGMLLLCACAIRPNPDYIEPTAAFWHMVDLVWVLLVPVVYLLR